ncbi:hypothetical protein CHUAL_014068 [Chamberlinius hualienensis]
MLDFVIFAVCFVTFLVVLVFYLYPGARKSGTTIPGMNPSDPKEGNLLDIQQVGSLHAFLRQLHEEYGDIASFWLETQLIVSLASPRLFMDHQHVFDRPGDQFHYLKPLFGENSIFFANGSKGRQQHALIADVLSRTADTKYCSVYKQLSKELIEKLEKLPADQHIPLHQYMLALGIKCLLIVLFGDYFRDPANIIDFRSQLDIVSNHIDQQLYGTSINQIETQKRKVEQAIEFIRSKIKMLLSTKSGLMAEYCQVSEGNQEQNVDNAITIIYEGFYSTANFLTWALHFIATHEDVQEKLFKDISERAKESLSFQEVTELKYLNCVLNETLRWSCLRTFDARVQDIDVDIGGHLIPKGTPVIRAIGVVLESEAIWNEPDCFDPERFNEEQVVTRKPLSFCPFGIGTKRPCPGKQFAINIVANIVSEIILSLKLSSINCQVERNFRSAVTKPEEEIWITVSKRR